MNRQYSTDTRPWSDMLQVPDDIQLSLFRQTAARASGEDMKAGFRPFAADLLARGLIGMGE